MVRGSSDRETKIYNWILFPFTLHFSTEHVSEMGLRTELDALGHGSSDRGRHALTPVETFEGLVRGENVLIHIDLDQACNVKHFAKEETLHLSCQQGTGNPDLTDLPPSCSRSAWHHRNQLQTREGASGYVGIYNKRECWSERRLVEIHEFLSRKISFVLPTFSFIERPTRVHVPHRKAHR